MSYDCMSEDKWILSRISDLKITHFKIHAKKGTGFDGKSEICFASR